MQAIASQKAIRGGCELYRSLTLLRTSSPLSGIPLCAAGCKQARETIPEYCSHTSFAALQQNELIEPFKSSKQILLAYTPVRKARLSLVRGSTLVDGYRQSSNSAAKRSLISTGCGCISHLSPGAAATAHGCPTLRVALGSTTPSACAELYMPYGYAIVVDTHHNGMQQARCVAIALVSHPSRPGCVH